MSNMLELIYTKKQSSLAGQVITLMVGCVLLSQLFMTLVFSVNLRDRLNAIRAHSAVGRLVPTYKIIDAMPQAKRDELLSIINSFQTQYFVFSEQADGDTFDEIKFQETPNFKHQLADTKVYKSEQNFGVKEMLKFWFTDSLNNCFLDDDEAFLNPSCPFEIYRIQLSDNSWFVSKTNPPPVVAVVLGPVVISGLITLILMFIAIKFMVRRLTAPLNSLCSAAEKLGRGETVEHIDSNAPRELAVTIDVFNQMQDRLSRFVKDRVTMLGAVSHDLRTPVTSLRIRAEFIKDERLRKQIIDSIDDIQTMIGACLNFSKQEFDQDSYETIDLTELFNSISDDLPEISFKSSLQQCSFKCNVIEIKRAIRNLAENAVKYANGATIELIGSDDHILVIVDDAGPGVPEESLEYIFDPFIRLDGSRNTESGSVGLGLAITRTIVHKHGGTIKAKNTNNGLRIEIKFPRQWKLENLAV